ncbi:penicillin-binding protein 1B [Nitrincola schmidtii]|uniref:penicillin-binding protein 1B n=1 Tax=Nitrincola schmidtii TaxID=1730894 RepID=UPI00124ED80A|nr:penicillin-binding protein 1B [Nitrincola schmidtii]
MQKKRVKKSQSSGRKAKKRRSILGYILSLLLKLSILGVVFCAVLLVYVDGQVREKFEGKRWELPAKVYARPLEIFVGQSLPQDHLRKELSQLGYRVVSSASGPGTAEFASSRVRVFTRGFVFPDEIEPSRRLLIDFAQGKVQRIVDESSQQQVALVRLEPSLIGGIYPRSNEDRHLIRLQDSPPLLKEALLVVEDREFYDHYGISPKGMMRAAIVNARAGRFVQGGSTLTQQLIKNFYLTSDRTLSRKLLELPMALAMDFRYEKDEILEAYLNEVYLGQSGVRAIHGFGLASQFYFGRPISELELHQVALLVALVKGPSFYDPRRNPERAKARRDLVINLLADHNSISTEERDLAIAEPLGVRESRRMQSGNFPAYMDLVKRQLLKEYRDEDLSTEGLLIFTALDPISQAHADAAMSEMLADLQKRHGERAGELEGAMVVTDPRTGEVLAMVGGKDTRFEGFNRALDARRAVGSLIKPAIYLAAIEQGYTLASVLNDTPVELRLPNGDIWSPQNFDRQSHGDVLLITALARSFNQSAVNLGLEIGLSRVIDVLRRLGVERNIQALPSLMLGAQEMTPLEMAEVYQTFAADGFRMPLRSIRMVTTADGQELSRYPFQLRQQVAAEPTYLIRYAMQEVGKTGTARSAYQKLPADLNFAGKTGTSNDQRDSWFAGFTGSRLAIVWVGRDDNRPLPFTSTGGALPIWTEFMHQERSEPLVSRRPANISLQWIDESSGRLSDPICEGSRQLPFIQGTEPRASVDCGQFVPALQPSPSESDSGGWFRNIFR